MNAISYLRRPVVALAVFLAVHTVIWTLVPVLVHTGMPMDVVEGYAIGREWVVGTFKHPAMPSWLLEVLRYLTGAVGWPAYFLSSVCVVATYIVVFLLGRDLAGEKRGAAGALLLSGVLYFSWVSPEFNHNVLQMPFWAGAVLSLWRARETGGNHWWALLGALAAGGIYAKVSMVVLLFVVTAYILLDRKCRSQLSVRGPWIALGVFLLLITPLINWLVETNFLLLDYAEARATRGRAGGVLLFLWKQVASSTGLLLLLVLAAIQWMPFRSGTAPARYLAGPSGLPAAAISAEAGRFVRYFFWAPIAFTVVSAAITGVGLKGAWGTSMLSLAGLTALVAADRWRVPLALPRIAAGAFVLLAIIPAAYAASVSLSDRFSKSPPRVAWPQAAIGARLQQIWRERTGQPLRVVAGDLWIAGMVAATASDRPSMLIDSELTHSPWIDRATLEAKGVLVVWWRQPTDPKLEFPHVRVLGVDGTEVFHINFGRQGRNMSVYYAIVPPGTKLKLGNLERRR